MISRRTSERILELLEEQRAATAALAARVDELGTWVPQELRNAVARDAHAVAALQLRFGGVDVSGASSWAALPESMLLLVELVSRLPVGSTVVELGSGTSTVWMALAARERAADGIRIVSLEHDDDWGARTRAQLDRVGAGGHAEVRRAALTEQTWGDWSGNWYDPAALAGLDSVGLVFVDGPPGLTGPLARYPGYPALRELLADGAHVVLDDIGRDEEQQIVEAWSRDGALTEVRRTERTVVLRSV